MRDEVPTLHIRNVPAELVEALKASAAANGRSLNAEVIDVLAQPRRRFVRDPSWRDWLETAQAQVREARAAGAPSLVDLIHDEPGRDE